MKKVLLTTATIMLAVVATVSGAKASTINTILVESFNQALLSDEVGAQGLKLKVGDMAQYSLKAGFISGKMIMTVKDLTADEAVITQDLDLGFAGKQACEVTLNPNTGETKKMVCNGQDQKPQDPSDIEVVETKEDTIKVPAGQFVCIYVKAHIKSQNQDVEQWVNMKDVPVFGLVKTLAPSQLGKVSIELEKFKKN